MASLVNGLGGDRGFGEDSVSRNDDSYSSAIDITSIFEGGLNLFGTVYENMYVNTNGNITFTGGLSTYTPGSISAGSNPIFAPYWADVDTRAGEVTASTSTTSSVDYSLNAYRTYLNDDSTYYNSLDTTSAISNYNISNYNLSSYSSFISSVNSLTAITETSDNEAILSSYYSFLSQAQTQIDAELGDSNYNTSGNSTGSNLVWYDLDEDSQTITVTWDDVGYYSYKMDKTNAFQLQLHNTGTGDVDISFIYEDVNWTTGSASGGTNGFGGTVSRAGYSAGDGEHYFEVPFAGDQNSMLNLENFSINSTTPGIIKLSMSGGDIQGIGLDGIADNLEGTVDNDYFIGMGGDDIIHGDEGNDTLDGGEGNDTLDGGIGDDRFYTGIGEDIVYGGEGTDFVIYTDNLNSYDFNNPSDYFSVSNSDATSTDSLYGVENLTFDDLTISVDRVEELISLEESVTRLYNALLGRNPDNAGINYWVGDVMGNDNSIQGMSGAFAGSEEYLSRFGAQSDADFIDQLYNNILGRSADQAGVNYWSDEIARTGDRTGMIVSFSEGEEFVNAQDSTVNSYLDNISFVDAVTNMGSDLYSTWTDAIVGETDIYNTDIIAGVRGNTTQNTILSDTTLDLIA